MARLAEHPRGRRHHERPVPARERAEEPAGREERRREVRVHRPLATAPGEVADGHVLGGLDACDRGADVHAAEPLVDFANIRSTSASRVRSARTTSAPPRSSATARARSSPLNQWTRPGALGCERPRTAAPMPPDAPVTTTPRASRPMSTSEAYAAVAPCRPCLRRWRRARRPRGGASGRPVCIIRSIHERAPPDDRRKLGRRGVGSGGGRVGRTALHRELRRHRVGSSLQPTRAGLRSPELFRVQTTGGTVRQITTGRLPAIAPSFLARRGTRSSSHASGSGKLPGRVNGGGGCAGSPRARGTAIPFWSPDGKTIAFLRPFLCDAPFHVDRGMVWMFSVTP